MSATPRTNLLTSRISKSNFSPQFNWLDIAIQEHAKLERELNAANAQLERVMEAAKALALCGNPSKCSCKDSLRDALATAQKG